MPEVIYDAGSWIYKMFMTFIIAAVSIGIVGLNIVNDMNTIDIQRGLLLNRILYSPDGIWHSENDVVIPGEVDISKFDQVRIDQNFNYPSMYGGANITLLMGGVTIGTVFVNEATFRNLQAQIDGNMRNSGTLETHVYPVIMHTGRGDGNGQLYVRIAMPETT